MQLCMHLAKMTLLAMTLYYLVLEMLPEHNDIVKCAFGRQAHLSGTILYKSWVMGNFFIGSAHS